MEEEKRKRKRKKSRKKKSKSLSVEGLALTVTCKSNPKDIKSSNEKAYLLAAYTHACKKAKIIDIENTREEAVRQNTHDFKVKLKSNRSRKKRKRIKTEKFCNLAIKSPNFKDGAPCDKKHSIGINQSVLNESTSEVKLKKSSVAFRQTLSNNISNIPTQKLSLKAKLQNKLESGRFRWINEKLYTADSLCAFQMFKAEPALFDVYHQGFSSQVQKWPVNPVDTMIDWIMERSPELIIADMGCGEAKISQSVPNKVFSFDLVAVNNFVTACDMAKVPLADESIDIVIYCLSLMGTNLNDFLQEAYRILKSNGILKIAEVVSRFECLRSFEETVCSFGFKLLAKDTTNKMFVQFEFKKLFKKPDQTTALPLTLKPCLYKRR